MALLSDALLAVDKTKETIIMLAEKVKTYPYLVTLLLKQSQAFIKYEYYEYALRLARVCVDLCPESFEAWLLLAECYFYERKFKMSLIALDIAPLYQDIQYISSIPPTTGMEKTNPKVRNSTDSYAYIMMKPTKVDFRKNPNAEPEPVADRA